MTRELCIVRAHITVGNGNRRTPAINSPNATPSSGKLPMLKLVSAGLQRLPGVSVLDKPSNNSTPIIKSVDKIPIIDA